MTMTLVPYSYVGSGVAVNGQNGTASGTVTLDWETTWASDHYLGTGPSIDSEMAAGLGVWEAACNILFIKVPDSGAALPVFPTVAIGPVVRFYLAPAGIFDFYANTAEGTGPQNWGSVCFNSAASGSLPMVDPQYELENSIGWSTTNWVPRIIAHEMVHSILGLSDNNADTTSIRYQYVYESTTLPVMNSTDISEAQTAYGAPQTNAALVGTGMPLGEIYSAYMGANNAAPDNAGLVFWYNAVVSNSANFATLCADLVGTATTTTAATTQYYQNCLGRTPNSTELAYWAPYTKAVVLAGVAASSETGGDRATTFASALWFS